MAWPGQAKHLLWRLIKPAGYWIFWNQPRLYLHLITRLRLRASPFFRMVESCRGSSTASLSNSRTEIYQTQLARKRVLFAIHWYELGGAESFALYTIRKAAELGNQCYCISTAPSPNSEHDIFAEHCEEALAYSDSSKDNNFRNYILNYIRIKQIDIVHIHHSVMMYEVLPDIRREFPELRIVDTTHIVEYGNGGFPYLSAQFSPFINKHHVTSQMLARVHEKLHYQIHGTAAFHEKYVLGYLCNLLNMSPIPTQPESTVRKVVLFYGRIAFQKQPNLFIATLEQLFRMHPDLPVDAHIYGEGDLEPQLIARIKASPYRDRFHILGRCDDKRAVFANADVLFLSSINEGIAITTYEALQLNRLVVSSNVGAQSELLCERCLIEMNADFIDSAAERLQNFLTDENFRLNAMAQNLENLNRHQLNPVNGPMLMQLYGLTS